MEGNRKVPAIKSRFVCQDCSYTSFKWLGRCPGCGQWGTLVEEREGGGLPDTAILGSGGLPPRQLDMVPPEEGYRLSTGFSEMDRVLGGGMAAGSLILLGGEPGIGKSSLLLQVAGAVASQRVVLYVSAEESVGQVKLRAGRLGISGPSLLVASESDVGSIRQHVQTLLPKLVIVDSIQTVYDPELSSAPGSVAQVRECAGAFLRLAKEKDITFLLVGHVTKDGFLAGPKVLEHLVDTVLNLEGERHSNLRILRAVKNRFGSTNEIGVFEMAEEGLIEVANPSALFLARHPGENSGSVVVAGIEGTRPVLLELQALVAPTSFGNPRRLTAGLDLQRTLLLMAVMEKRGGLFLGDQDVYLNLAGGLRLDEPAVDLGICLAVASSLLEKPLGKGLVVAGEVGLTGETRRIAQAEKRANEAARLGFSRIILPLENLRGSIQPSIETMGAGDLAEAFRLAGLR